MNDDLVPHALCRADRLSVASGPIVSAESTGGLLAEVPNTVAAVFCVGMVAFSPGVSLPSANVTAESHHFGSAPGGQVQHHLVYSDSALVPRSPLPDTFQRRLSALRARTSSPNWDDEGAQPVPAARWDDASRLASLIHTVCPEPLPFISPDADGSVHLSWSKGGGHVIAAELATDGYWSSTLIDNKSDAGQAATIDELACTLARLLRTNA